MMNVLKFTSRMSISVLLISTMALGVTSMPVSQSQESDNYGFFFDKDLNRYQEFVPYIPNISEIGVLVSKVGSPGDLALTVEFNNTSVWNMTITESYVQSGWNNFSTNLMVNPGELYKLIISSNQSSLDPNNRYFWRGHTNSNYTLGSTDVSFSWPTFDYSFFIIGSPILSEIEVDQEQNLDNYGFFFDETLFRSQEFVPEFTDLSRVDVLISKSGNAGSLILSVEGAEGAIASRSISANSFDTGWVTFDLIDPVELSVGQIYTISLTTDLESITPADRYFWRGYTNSNYTEGNPDVHLSWPQYDYAFVTWGSEGNRYVDTDLPNIDSPFDLSYHANTTGHTINWSVSDENPYYYEISVNGIVRITENWNQTEIEYNIDGLEVGQHAVELSLWDTFGNNISDIVLVHVIAVDNSKGSDPDAANSDSDATSTHTETSRNTESKSDLSITDTKQQTTSTRDDFQGSTTPDLPVPGFEFLQMLSLIAIFIVYRMTKINSKT